MQRCSVGPFHLTVTDYTYDVPSSFFCFEKQDVNSCIAKSLNAGGPLRLKAHFLTPHRIFTFQYISDQCFSNNFSCFKYFPEQFDDITTFNGQKKYSQKTAQM